MEHRKALLGRLAGRGLEIGGGTGANLPYYADRIEELVITEPEEPMPRRVERKLADHPPPRGWFARAEALPSEDQSFDFAVSTLVLCRVDDPKRARGAPLRRGRPALNILRPAAAGLDYHRRPAFLTSSTQLASAPVLWQWPRLVS